MYENYRQVSPDEQSNFLRLLFNDPSYGFWRRLRQVIEEKTGTLKEKLEAFEARPRPFNKKGQKRNTARDALIVRLRIGDEMGSPLTYGQIAKILRDKHKINIEKGAVEQVCRKHGLARSQKPATES